MSIPKSNRIIDQLFKEFLSDPSLTSEFERLRNFLDSNSTDFNKFAQTFMTKSKKRTSLPSASLPKSPIVIKTRNTPIRRSLDTTINLQTLQQQQIPLFYPIKHNPTGIVRSLQPPDTKLTISHLSSILRGRLNLPSFFALPLMVTIDPSILQTRKFEIPFGTFIQFAEKNIEGYSLQEKVFNIIDKEKKGYLIPNDFAPFIASLIQTHQSLKFLKHEVSLQSAFTKCIIARIFYTIDTELRNRITFPKFACSNFCECLNAVDVAADVSDVLDFFSYEHFYVLFTKFWAIDVDETGAPTIDQLTEYDDFRIAPHLVKRLVNLIPTNTHNGTISFTDFVYFVNAVEDKSSETALRLWFKVCDLDENGIISLAEIHDLYRGQKIKMAQSGMDPVKFKLILSQLVDIVDDTNVTIHALRRSGKWATFFNIIADFKKFTEWEFRDPMFEMKAAQKYVGMKEWDIFCQNEYISLSNE